MKQGIHPKYMRAVVSCACGNRFETRATVPEIRLEICSNCHPFYTGRQKFVDSAGRVERFQRKWKRAPEKRKPAKRGQGAAPAEAPAEAAAGKQPGESPAAQA